MSTPFIIYSSPSGLIKGLHKNSVQPINIASVTGQNISSICWHSNNTTLYGTRSGSIYKQDLRETLCTEVVTGTNDPVVSLIPESRSLFAIMQSGAFRHYESVNFESKSVVNLPGPVSVARLLSPMLAVGGKSNNLSVWDVENPQQPIFRAKNVRPTTLQLEVPVWVSDICFVPTYAGKIVLTSSRYGELNLYDLRCGQRRPVCRHAWRMSRKHGKLKVGKCVHGAVLPDLSTTRPITRALAFDSAPGVSVRVVAGNVIGDLCFIDMRLPHKSTVVPSIEEDEVNIQPGSIKSFGARTPEAPVAVRTLPCASGSITGLACGGAGQANSPITTPSALFNSQPCLVASSLDRYIRIYNRDSGVRLLKLYAKLPITSFMISDDADLLGMCESYHEDETADPSVATGDVGADNELQDDVEFEKLWARMEPVSEVSDSPDAAANLTKRKRRT